MCTQKTNLFSKCVHLKNKNVGTSTITELEFLNHKQSEIELVCHARSFLNVLTYIRMR